MSGGPDTKVKLWPPPPSTCQSGAIAGKELMRNLKKPTKHPNILQLYGICRSPHLTALVFHGAPSLMYRPEYYKMLPSSQWIPHYVKLHQQNESAHSMLETHDLYGWPLRISNVDETGKLVIDYFFSSATVHSAFDPRICTAFETNTFIKEDLLAYYKFLFDMIDWPIYVPTSTLLSPFDKAAPFQLSHPEINFPVYSLPGWNQIVFSVNEMDTTVGETGIVLKLLPSMTIRCCIPTTQVPTFSIYEYMMPFEQTDMTLFATWACQANHLIHDLPINIMDLQTGAGNIYWSLDEQGHHVIEVSLIQAAFGITVDWHWFVYGRDIQPQYYKILQTIHEACGFDPYSTQVAEYLGVPLAVADSGHSGLEEGMHDSEESELRDSDYVLRDFNSDVEDPEYDSESESGDSDYVSASEDA
ncbi:hypothetical protein C8J56DRAFT_1165040 [Mycena floridula]|nr:hypothetical protein C8J56DRAFT_1165040 [Mycena floridula]